MEKVEQYIKEHTNRYSNHVELAANITGFTQWITVDDARRIAEIAREETIKEVREWLDSHTMLSEKWYIEDLKKHLDGKK